MQNLKVVLSLGNISHTAVLMALGQKKTAFKFVHGAAHEIPAFAGMTKGGGRESGVGGARSADRPSLEPRSIGVAGASAREHRNIILLNTYHTSRYNMNTRRLTQEMFDAVVEQAKTLL